jgi:hypothetical protein
VALLAAAAGAACQPPAEGAGPPRSTLVIGIDVSGSFRASGHYEDAIDFASRYLHAHLNGLGGLRVPTAVFVGSVGGERPGETKAFHPIHDFLGKSPEQIATDLYAWFPPEDRYTDFNAFIERVSVLVKRQNLILAPLNIVLLSDGVPDVVRGAGTPAAASLYSRIDLNPLEFLSRSVTVRLLYGTPSVAAQWEREVKRRRVRLWTQDAVVMAGWRAQLKPELPPERQDALWDWVNDNVDFRVRRSRVL